MSRRLIKRYKYIDKETVQIVDTGKVLKNSDCSPVNYSQFYEDDPEYGKQAEELEVKETPQAGRQSDPVQVIDSVDQPETKTNGTSDAPPSTADIDALVIERTKGIEDQLKNQYEAQLTSTKQISFNEGMQEGKKAGQAENAAEIESLRNLVTNIQSEFADSASKFFEEVEKLTMDMSVYLAKKIIGDAVGSVPDIIRTNVDKCVKLLAGAGTAQIKINPNDYDTIKSYIPELEQKSEGKFTFVLEPDNSIDRGGCVVEFEGSSIDGRINTQIDKIQKQMEMIT